MSLITPENLTKFKYDNSEDAYNKRYLRVKYIGRKTESIGDALKLETHIKQFDATKYPAYDLLKYVEWRNEDKWVDGSEYSPDVHDIDFTSFNIRFEYGERSRSHYPIELNFPANDDLSKFQEPFNGVWKFDSRIVRFAPNVVQFYSEPRPEFAEECKENTFSIKNTFGCWSKDRSIRYMTEIHNQYFPDNKLAAAMWKLVLDATHCLIAQLEDTGAVYWTVVCSKDMF